MKKILFLIIFTSSIGFSQDEKIKVFNPQKASRLSAIVPGLGQVYNIVNPDPITWNQWYCSVAKALEVEIRTVPVAQETLVAINAERFKGLADNFGHTQVFDNQKLAKVIPNFQPKTPLVESLLENIEWMDQHNRIPNSDADLLEDKIISAIRKLPTQI